MRRSSKIVVAAVAGGVCGSVLVGLGQPERGGRGGGVSPEELADRLMARDANGDGKLSRDEMPGQFADRMFEGDSNGDGFLTRDEILAFGAQRGGGGGNAPALGADASFHDHMEAAGRAMRGLSRSNFDGASRERDLAAIQRVQYSLVAAKGQAATVDMAPQAKAKYGDDVEQYRKDMRLALIEAIVRSAELEAAVVRGNGAKAAESFEKLHDAEEVGHDAFEPKEDQERGRAPGGRGGVPRGGL